MNFNAISTLHTVQKRCKGGRDNALIYGIPSFDCMNTTNRIRQPPSV